MGRQYGLASVELALISPLFFLLFFSIIEVGRMGYVWNTLDAVTQRAARTAVVCPPGHSKIRHVAMFGKSSESDSGISITGLTVDNIQIEYLDKEFKSTAGKFPIFYVRASVQNYSYKTMIPGLGQYIDVPDFETTLPAESLGYMPGKKNRSCFGTKV